MKVFCDNCMGENEINEEQLEQNGFRTACQTCGHMIFVDSEEVQALQLRKKLRQKSGTLSAIFAADSDGEDVQETDLFGSVPQDNLTTTVAADIELPQTHTSPAVLVIVEGPDAGLEIPMESSRLVFGRRGADINLNDRLVSRRHAAIESGSGRYLLKDLGSTNGTFLNGQPAGMEFLKHGDEIQLGSTLIRFRIRGMESSIVVLD
ncbi:FHA domain-containing protein [bacterium]|nr:FHA domain-containing protein [bacterium]